MGPVRVFVASTPAEWLPAKVLEFSIRETTALPVEVSLLYTFQRPIPTPRDVANRPRTPFSFQRFLIPELCGHTGRAIYLDADMQVFKDIAGIWSHPLAGCDLQTVSTGDNGRRGQFSVMLLDCARLGWDVDDIVAALDAGTLHYEALMYEMRVASQVGRDIPRQWNSLERYEEGATALLHYTDMNTQPWVSLANPLDWLWVACLRRALHSGFISRTELEREVLAGHVRPSLVAQIDTDIDHGAHLPRAIRQLDRSFVPPYRFLISGQARPWTSARARITTVLRRLYYGSGLPGLLR